MQRTPGLLRVLSAAGICAAGVPWVPAAEPIETPDARIVEVTVYRDRAEIVRQARVQVPAGASAVEFAGIPAGVEPDSLRVAAEGLPCRLGAVELAGTAGKPEETPEYLAAQDDVRRLERAVAAATDHERIDSDLKAYLDSLRATATTESARLADGGADPAAIAAVYDLMAGKLEELSARRLERHERLRLLGEELEVARAKLATLAAPAEIRARVATVEIEADRGGSLTLRLAYVVPRSTWRPSYRATLDAATGEVHVVAEGVVSQNTGEGWSGVALKLSTAAPSQGVQPPHLDPWFLRPASVDLEGGFAERDRFYQNVLTLAPGASEPGAPAEEAVVVESELVRSAYNVAFAVPGVSDVPADGRDHRVVLRAEKLAGQIVYRTVPGMESRAYLTSVTTAPADYPLLAGPVRVFAEGAYLGSFRIEETGPGQELRLPFGADNRIEVVRVPLPRTAGRDGFAGRMREMEYGFRTEMTNRLDRPVTLVLEERLPVSEDERIEVTLGKETTPGHRESERRPGVKIWTLELAPGEKRELLFGYTVRHPKDLYVPGLD
ncbi:MAG TPA: DUF4139 domain-containing protein [Candidatus Polarisedimenticolaceae bacterium]|nr:DUF4139 domain-containing protein [Candidatus Polarisedimenticolaceae bacterium]